MKLDIQHKHILKLVDRDADEEGWTSVSEKLYPVLSKAMPPELVIFELIDDGFGVGRARLTNQGQMVLYAMEWL